jgi:hypothetical protein
VGKGNDASAGAHIEMETVQITAVASLVLYTQEKPSLSGVDGSDEQRYFDVEYIAFKTHLTTSSVLLVTD